MAVTTSIEFFGTASVSAPDIGACWNLQNGGGIAKSKTRSGELGAAGDELLSALWDEKWSTSFTYVFKQPSTAVSNYPFPKVGDVIGGWHIDGFSCAWSRDKAAATLTLNCHKHGNANHDACRKYTPSLSAIAVASFGVPSAFGTAFTLAQGTSIDLRSATYSVQCNHVDEPARDGTHLAGNNYDGSETLAVELTGAAGSDDYTTTWDNTSANGTPSNTGVTTTSLTLEHHLAHDVVSGT